MRAPPPSRTLCVTRCPAHVLGASPPPPSPPHAPQRPATRAHLLPPAPDWLIRATGVCIIALALVAAAGGLGATSPGVLGVPGHCSGAAADTLPPRWAQTLHTARRSWRCRAAGAGGCSWSPRSGDGVVAQRLGAHSPKQQHSRRGMWPQRAPRWRTTPPPRLRPSHWGDQPPKPRSARPPAGARGCRGRAQGRPAATGARVFVRAPGQCARASQHAHAQSASPLPPPRTVRSTPCGRGHRAVNVPGSGSTCESPSCVKSVSEPACSRHRIASGPVF